MSEATTAQQATGALDWDTIERLAAVAWSAGVKITIRPVELDPKHPKYWAFYEYIFEPIERKTVTGERTS